MNPVFAITMGDPCGIGPEIVLKTLMNHPELNNKCQFIVCGSADILEKTAHQLKLSASIKKIKVEDIPHKLPEGICCLDIDPVYFNHELGQISAEGGKYSFSYIEKAIELATNGTINGIVTAPINKKSLKAGAVPYLDHTEMFTKLTDKFRTMAYGLTTDENKVNEAVQELMLYFLQMNPDILKGIYEKDGILGITRYGAVALRRALTSTRSNFYYKYARN